MKSLSNKLSLLKEPGKAIISGGVFSLTLIATLEAESLTPETGQLPPVLAELRDASPDRILIAAHRGGYENDKADKAPENSVANLVNLHQKGYELYETDIQRTRDGHFVIVHDPTIDRETSGTGTVSEMTLKELKSFRKRFRDGTESEQTIATLDEFLVRGKGLTLFKADLKPGVSKYFADLMALVAEHDALNGIIFRVPYYEANLFGKYRDEGGVIAQHTLMFKVTTKDQVNDIKERFESTTIEVKLNKSDPVNAKSLELIEYARKKGFIVETHAEGNAGDWATLINAGVRIFHTSRPSTMKAFLETRANTP
ncbi:MAG: glycerophosphodiester phosphodiesterase family protein [Verrucomicrobiales bacterium]|nr:glycerophosphodiester phosphodiesterase family protein [Verrucomicrobiales bacterium]